MCARVCIRARVFVEENEREGEVAVALDFTVSAGRRRSGKECSVEKSRHGRERICDLDGKMCPSFQGRCGLLLMMMLPVVGGAVVAVEVRSWY